MKGRAARLVLISPLLALTASVLFVSPVIVSGQGGSRPGRDPADIYGRSKGVRQASIREREFKLLEIEREAAKAKNAKDQKAWLAQIAEDFQRIQELNNKVISATISSRVPDYETIADSTAEIAKRAGRMKKNLSLPESEIKSGEAARPEYKNVDDSAGMKAAVLVLDTNITSFVHNPIFTNPSVVVIEEGAKVKRDLDTIVDFGNRISGDAKKLSKSSKRR